MATAQDFALTFIDRIMAAVPQSVPGRRDLQNCRLVSHRGDHTQPGVQENTLLAFDLAREAGVWGIECDIRWTADLVPVICHDETPERVFGVSTPLAAISMQELRARLPLIPTLEEVVERFGGKTHLMLEIKPGHWPDPGWQSQTLLNILSSITPGEDYHILSLETDLFDLVPGVERRHCLPVAQVNIQALEQYALVQGCAGLAGHYLLISQARCARLAAHGQKAATGFPASRSALYRDLDRGIDWIFTNDAVALQRMVDEALAQYTD